MLKNEDHGCYRCTKPGEYPWPCEPMPERTIKVFDDDVFTKGKDDSSWNMITGIYKGNVQIPEEYMELWPEEPNLVMTNL